MKRLTVFARQSMMVLAALALMSAQAAASLQSGCSAKPEKSCCCQTQTSKSVCCEKQAGRQMGCGAKSASRQQDGSPAAQLEKSSSASAQAFFYEAVLPLPVFSEGQGPLAGSFHAPATVEERYLHYCSLRR